MNTPKQDIFFLLAFLAIFSACKGPLRTAGKAQSAMNAQNSLGPKPEAEDLKKPHVMIMSSTGGGGQTSAALAVQSYLAAGYRVSIVHIVSEVWGKFDPIKFCSAHAMNGEDLYNFFLKNGFNWSGGMWCFMGTWISSLFEDRLSRSLETFLLEKKPDVIISVVPFVNGAIYKTAERLDIPFGIISVDLDLSTYLHGIYEPVYEKFYVGIPFEDRSIRSFIQEARIPDKQVRVVGFPVRKEFLHMQDREAVRSSFGFPVDKPVVMVLMGAAGSRTILSYARKLAKMKVPMHIIFCIGRNEGLRQYMERIQFPAHISVSIFGFTDKIADLMRASDLLISKTGSVTVCESFYAQVPLLLDYTATVLTWEYLNIEFVRAHGFGDVITSLHRLSWHVSTLLKSEEKMNNMRAAMKSFTLPDVELNVCTLINDMIELTSVPT